jgi:hypothetical protein
MMAASYVIRILEGVTEDEVRAYDESVSPNDDIFYKIVKTPGIEVGEVSWLKAALFDQPDVYIPGPIARLKDIIGDGFPVIDDAFIEAVERAFEAPNTTQYRLNDPTFVLAFLREHKGKKCFAATI